MWAYLDEARESGETQAIQVNDLLTLAEQAVLMTGQAAMAVRHVRKTEIMASIMPVKEAKRLLRKHNKCPATGDLLGTRFQRKIQKHAQKRQGPALGIFAMKKQESRPKHGSSFPAGPPRSYRAGAPGGRDSGRGRDCSTDSRAGRDAPRGRGRADRDNKTGMYPALTQPSSVSSQSVKIAEGPISCYCQSIKPL